MPHVRIATEDMPLGQRLMEGLRYPLRGGALAACITLGLCHYAVLLPSVIGLIAALVVWSATWRYAIDCMVQTADGYQDPPEVHLEGRAGNPRGIFALHIVVILVCILIMMFAPGSLWLMLAIAALLLPAIDMSLAFDGDVMVALNPVTWTRIVARFGTAYIVPVVANAALALLVGIANNGIGRLPRVLALPVFGFVGTYLVVLDFHWMGVLVWHFRERFGMNPEAPAMARARGQNADDELVRECEALAQTDPEAAAIRLRDRIRERAAPASVHMLFRVLLRKLARNDLLLSHGRTWITQLCTGDDARRALGLVKECREIDPGFLPDDPEATAALARLAARSGMRDMASHLARGFVARWSRHPSAEEIGKLAADADHPA